MVGKVSAENALGQVLICVRMSKLNFIVKETPYSLYLTIRKKFVKDVDSDVTENENVWNERENMRNVDTVQNLQQKISDLSIRYGLLEFQKEELEVKYEALDKAKINMEDQIEEVYAINREFSKSNEKLVIENTELKVENEKIKSEMQNTLKASQKIKLLEDTNKDLDEKINVGKYC